MSINKITITSSILSFVAGYADTSTFVRADRLFSAHITGNLVVLVYDIITNQISSSRIKCPWAFLFERGPCTNHSNDRQCNAVDY